MSDQQNQFLKHIYTHFAVQKTDTRYRVDACYPLIFDSSQYNSSPYVINIDGERVGVLLLGYYPGEYDNLIYLAYIHIDKPKRNMGIATSVMNKISEVADLYNITINLSAVPIEHNTNDISSSKLKNWYRTFGFIQNSSVDATLMKREPKTS